MKKITLALLSAAALYSSSSAQESPALSQLIQYDAGLSIPQPPPPDRRGYFAANFQKWDPAQPLCYSQGPAEIVSFADGTAVIRNVRYGVTPADQKSFSWDIVTINTALIEKAIYAYKTAGTGHTFLVFIFKPGGAVNSSGTDIKSLTFGAEGWSREPYGYIITHALAGRYPLIWLSTTFESFADEAVRIKGRNIFLRNMNLDKEQTKRLFSLLVPRMDETNRNGEFYDLFHNSCTNNPVNLINQVIPEKQRISLEIADHMNPNASIPVFAAKKYEKNGVLRAEEFEVTPANLNSFDITRI